MNKALVVAFLSGAASASTDGGKNGPRFSVRIQSQRESDLHDWIPPGTHEFLQQQVGKQVKKKKPKNKTHADSASAQSADDHPEETQTSQTDLLRQTATQTAAGPKNVWETVPPNVFASDNIRALSNGVRLQKLEKGSAGQSQANQETPNGRFLPSSQSKSKGAQTAGLNFRPARPGVRA